MNIRCRENLEIQIYHHPHYQSLNEKLMDDFSKLDFTNYNPSYKYSSIKGSKFSFSEHDSSMKPRGVTLIENWVEQIIKDKIKCLFHFNFNTWAARLDRGQETIEHDHLYFASFAFVYFVNTPIGASPLVFTTSGKKIKAKPGKLALFPSSLKHKVPTNKCDKRITIASNITITEM